MLNNQEIERRKPLWAAFSDLWLDNDLQEFEIQNIVKLMKDSGFIFSELERIFYNEVAPAVYKNTFSMTGEWTGFESEWLYKTIIKNIQQQETNSLRKIWINSAAGRFMMTKMVEDDWKKITELYQKK